MLEIDIRDLVPYDVLHGLSPAILNVLVRDIADAARTKWIMLAQENLNTTSREYISNISTVQSLGDVRFIRLTGVLPNMIEGGFDRFDMRDTLLQGPGVREAANGGKYRYIFFRRGAPGGKRSVNFPKVTDLYARELGEKHAKKIGRKAHKAMKALDPTRSNPGQKTQWGEALSAGMAPKLREHHKTDLFAGTYRFVQETQGGKEQSFYGNFRTISENVPDGWIHPGYKPGEGANLTEQVGQYIEGIAPAMFDAVQATKGGD
jgi:hypothetical protein